MNDVAFSMDQNWLDGLKLRVFTSDFPMFSALGRCLRPQTMELQAWTGWGWHVKMRHRLWASLSCRQPHQHEHPLCGCHPFLPLIGQLPLSRLPRPTFAQQP
jgi:hypothetical protein